MIRTVTSTVHDAVKHEAVTNDMTKNEATNEAPNAYNDDSVKESESAKENYEISIRKVGSIQEQYPQIIASEVKQEVSEIPAGIKEREDMDAARTLIQRSHGSGEDEATTRI